MNKRYVYDVILISKNDGKIYRSVQGMALVSPGVTKMETGIIKPSTPPVFIGPEPPKDPRIGDLWWNNHEGRMYVYYQDTDSAQWVQTNPIGVQSGQTARFRTQFEWDSNTSF